MDAVATRKGLMRAPYIRQLILADVEKEEQKQKLAAARRVQVRGSKPSS